MHASCIENIGVLLDGKADAALAELQTYTVKLANDVIAARAAKS